MAECGYKDPGGPGAYCTKEAGHYGFHADGAYIFGPEKKEPTGDVFGAYRIVKPKKPRVTVAQLEKRVAALEKQIKEVGRAAYSADLATRKYK